MFLLFIVTSLFFSVKASHFNITIEKAEIKAIYNETINYCNSHIKSCIEIKICIEKSCKISSNGRFLNNSIQIAGENIQVLPSITIVNGSDESIQFNKSEILFENIKTITFRNFTYNYTLYLSLTVKCQEGFLSPSCSEIDLCAKVPSGMCQNQGLCIQNNSKISCQCHKEYTGNFCQEKNNPCENNFCSNNATCQKNSSIALNYECLCPPNFHGKFCDRDVNECLNDSICSHLPNSTCFNTYGSHICTCNKECTTMTTTTLSSTTIMDTTTSFFIKWPLTDLHTLVLVALEAAIILTLILVLIFVHIKYCPIKRTKSKFLVDDAYLFNKLNDNKKKNVDYDSNYARRPIISDNKHESSVPMYDIQELENTFHNLPSNSPGMSTFGRR